MMAPSVLLRDMTIEDVAPVAGLERLCSRDPWSESLFRGEFGTTIPRQWLVAVAGGDIIAFGGTLRVTDELHIMNLGVHPSWRRKGLAGLLLARLLRDGVDRGAVAATLEVRAGNRAAIELYQRFGFTVVGRRDGYYPDGEEAAIMWVHRMHRPAFLARLDQVIDRVVAGDRLGGST